MTSSIEQIRMLNLTTKDFDLLVEGLDELPNKGVAGDLMVSMLIAGLSKDDAQREEQMRKREIEMKKKEDAKVFLKEEVKILQGKLLMLKRYMQENKLLSDAYDILNIKQD
jgi:hypothetical protein